MKRQGVKDLQTTIAIVEALVDLWSSLTKECDKSKSHLKEKKSEKKKSFKKEVTQKSYVRKSFEEKTHVVTRQIGIRTKMIGCYICACPHIAHECSK